MKEVKRLLSIADKRDAIEIKADGTLQPDIVRGGDVLPEKVRHAWDPYIPRGKITMLEGNPGVGKGMLIAQIVRFETTGQAYPDKATGLPSGEVVRPPGAVVYLCAEDGIADTIRPRMDAAGADADRWFVLRGLAISRGDGEIERQGISLADIDKLEMTVDRTEATMVVIDPLDAYLGDDVDFHRSNEVRPILDRLGQLAEAYGITVIVVRHLSKSAREHSIYRGLGSIAFSAMARSILMLGFHPDDDEEDPSARRAIVHLKSSLTLRGSSLAFRPAENHQFFWLGNEKISADSMLAGTNADERSARDEAVSVLRDLLADGPRPSREVFSEAAEAGVAKRTLERAKKTLGVKSEKDGGQWLWSMPPEATPPRPPSVTLGGVGGLDGDLPKRSPTEGLPAKQDCQLGKGAQTVLNAFGGEIVSKQLPSTGQAKDHR